jgi:hypothetical protein
MTNEIVVARAPLRPRASWLSAWWHTGRSALAIDVYRIFIGAVLVLHFLGAWNDLPEAIGRRGLYLPTASIDDSWFARSIFTWSEEHGNWGRLVASLGVMLSLGITAGVASRVCAALLFLLATWIHRVAFATSSLDDALVGVVAFWLCILPIGSTLRIADISQRKAWRARRVEGWTALLFLLHLFVLHADIGLWQAYAPRWQPANLSVALLCAVPVALLIPSVAARAVAIGGLLALHLFLIRTSGLVFAHGAMIAALPLLLWDDRGESTDGALAQRPFSIGAALGFAAIVLTLVATLGRWLLLRTPDHPPPWALATASVLRDAGLLVAASGQRLPPRPLALDFEFDGRVEQLRLMTARSQMLLTYLAAPDAADPRVFNGVAEGALRLHCREDRTESGRVRLTLDGSAARKDVGTYQCARGIANFSPDSAP